MFNLEPPKTQLPQRVVLTARDPDQGERSKTITVYNCTPADLIALIEKMLGDAKVKSKLIPASVGKLPAQPVA